MKRFSTLMLVLCTCFVLAAWPQPPAKHKITKFNAPGAGKSAYQGTVGVGIVAGGSIVGWYVDSNNGYHGYLRTPQGKFTKFDPPGSQGTAPSGMNSALAITGSYFDSNDAAAHGFVRAPSGKFTTFDAPGAGTGSRQGTLAGDINTKGEIVGYYIDAMGVKHGFVRTPGGTYTSFDAPGAGRRPGTGTQTAFFSGLTDTGAIAGTYSDSNLVHHGYLRAPDGTFTTIDPPGSTATFVESINSKGVIAGGYFDSSGLNPGFLRAPDGTITEFHAPGASRGTAAGSINSSGAITGFYFGSNDDAAHGFVRAPSGKFTEFDVSGAGTGSSQGTEPAANNPAGAITGYYVDTNNVNHGFLRE